jgi:hypothetical protein
MAIPTKPKRPEPTVALTKLITNQLILGKTSTFNGEVFIEQPYEGIPTPDGLQIIPYDEHITGVKIESISIPESNTIYTNEVSQELSNLYLTQISGIDIPKPSLIL